MTWRISYDEISISLGCCIQGLLHPINKNYVFNMRHVTRLAAIVIHIAISVTNIAASGSRMDATFYLAVIRGVARGRPGSTGFNIISIIA